jgi:hypothetical protein
MPADRATQVATPAFDASVWELWPYLTMAQLAEMLSQTSAPAPGGSFLKGTAIDMSPDAACSGKFRGGCCARGPVDCVFPMTVKT